VGSNPIVVFVEKKGTDGKGIPNHAKDENGTCVYLRPQGNKGKPMLGCSAAGFGCMCPLKESAVLHIESGSVCGNYAVVQQSPPAGKAQGNKAPELSDIIY